jgi:hypothetical protein
VAQSQQPPHPTRRQTSSSASKYDIDFSRPRSFPSLQQGATTAAVTVHTGTARGAGAEGWVGGWCHATIPQEAGLVAFPGCHVPIEAVVSDVRRRALEPLNADGPIAHVKVELEVIALPLQEGQARCRLGTWAGQPRHAAPSSRAGQAAYPEMHCSSPSVASESSRLSQPRSLQGPLCSACRAGGTARRDSGNAPQAALIDNPRSIPACRVLHYCAAVGQAGGPQEVLSRGGRCTGLTEPR